MTLIFHTAVPEDWERARSSGVYTMSTRGQTLSDMGFIHCSYRHQIDRVANAFFGDLAVVTLLEMDTDDMPVTLVDENLEGGDELFPHLYRPLDVDWVRADREWRPDHDGIYRLASLET